MICFETFTIESLYTKCLVNIVVNVHFYFQSNSTFILLWRPILGYHISRRSDLPFQHYSEFNFSLVWPKMPIHDHFDYFFGIWPSKWT